MAGVSTKSEALTSQLFDAIKGSQIFQQLYSQILIKQLQQQQQSFDGLCQNTRDSPVPTMVINDSFLKSRPLDESNHSSPDTDFDEKPRKRIRIRGQSVKTAEVWKYFTQIPNEQAAICAICHKTIKATNSSTTGMIRHLRSCHTKEHELLQNARRENYLRKGLKNGVLDDQQLTQLAMLERIKEISSNNNNRSDTLSLINDHSINDSDTTSDLVDSITSASTSSVLSDSDMKPLHTIDRLMDSASDSSSSDKSSLQLTETSIETIDTSDENIDKVALQMEVNNRLLSMFSNNILPVDIVDNQLFRTLFHTLRPDLSLGTAADFRERIHEDELH